MSQQNLFVKPQIIFQGLPLHCLNLLTRTEDLASGEGSSSDGSLSQPAGPPPSIKHTSNPLRDFVEEPGASTVEGAANI